MKKLVRVKLINWHLFTNQTVHITDNILLTGENGAGKSTFLDAIQYVLTGGKAKFNTAANTRAKRDIQGYIRCKIGTENKTYIRNDEVISHIALEFYDNTNEETLIIGVVFEMNKSGRIYEHFYLINNSHIEDHLFIINDIIYGYANFKKYLFDKKMDFRFCETKEQTRNIFLHALGINNYKYIELIPKALAFRPIDELNKFVFDFLLNEKKVSLAEIRQSVRSYYEFEKLIQTLKEKETMLNLISSLNETYKNCEKRMEDNNKLIDYVIFEKLKQKKKYIIQELANIKEKIEEKQKNERIIDEELCKLKQEVEYLTNKLSKNDTYTISKEIDTQIEKKVKEEIQLKKMTDDLKDIINNEINLANYVYKEIDNKLILEEYLDAIITLDDLSRIKKIVLLVKEFYEELKDQFMIERVNCRKEKNELVQELDKLALMISKLKQNQFLLEHPIRRLKYLVESELSKKYSKDIKVNVLCEVISIIDENWRHACEGYLNTQRFDLIIDPTYFDEALLIYEKYKYEEKLYGVGLVNTQKMLSFKLTYEKSLASKISSENQYAKSYVNMLLNNVICCENVHELKQYKTAITKSCMVYKNYTVRQIKEEIYQKPFIGMDAIKFQLKNMIEKRDLLTNKLDECDKRIKKYCFYHERLKSHQLEYILHHIDELIEYNVLVKDIQELKQNREKYSLNSSFLEVENELNIKKASLAKYEIDKKQLLLEEGKYIGELEVKKARLVELEDEIALVDEKLHKDVLHLFIELGKQFDNDIDRMEKHFQQEMKQNESIMNKTKIELITNMNQYNNKFHVGFDTRIECLDEYMDELNKIKNYQLIKYEDKAKESRLQCEIAFKEQFIYRLRENILIAEEELNHLNQALKGKKFGGDEYEFIYKPNPMYQNYYQLIMSDESNLYQDLFAEVIDEKKKMVLRELFDQLVIDRCDEEKESILDKYTDYRNYMSYDIKIHHLDGESTLFSKVSREKSGGETQTPFYVVIAASFEQLITDKKRHSSPACFVMFDEAFNNMDESRIQAMMEFYSHLNIQLMIAVPPQRIDTILSHVNTTLVVMKDKEQSFIETFNYIKE